MPSSVYVGDAGTELVMNLGTDISDATVTKIKYKKPNGDIGEWVATIASNLQSISYSTESNDLDVSGEWSLQSYVVTPSWTGHGTTAVLIVRDLFD